MSEKTAYQLMRKKLLQPKDRMDRIEAGSIAGIPDVNYCIEGKEGWIELKAPKIPIMQDTMLFKSQHNLSQMQKNWFYRQVRAGGKCWVLIAGDTHWMLISGKYADEINELTAGELWGIASWKARPPRIDLQEWIDLRRTLKK